MSRPVPILTRLYVWSIVFEPLLFFSLFSQSVTGIGGSVSRLLQFMVVAWMLAILALAIGPKAARIRFVHLASPLYRNYRIYFVLAIIAGVLGAASGAFSVDAAYDTTGASMVSRFLNSGAVRPLFEYLIAAYYFIYFAILPQFFLSSRASLDYFFRAFRTMFIACLVIGAVDLAAASVGIAFLPRVFFEFGRTYVGARFHGLAGEPRDAFVYVFFALALLHLRAFHRSERLNRWWGMTVVTAAALTQSASGIVGLMIFVGLYAAHTLPVIGPKRVLQLAVVLVVVSVVTYETVVNSQRLMPVGCSSWCA